MDEPKIVLRDWNRDKKAGEAARDTGPSAT
jgi:hypothetical protein